MSSAGAPHHTVLTRALGTDVLDDLAEMLAQNPGLGKFVWDEFPRL